MTGDIRLANLIQALENPYIAGAVDITVSGITNDSRRVEPGKVFVATTGWHADGHDFVDDAVGRSAAAVVVERTFYDQRSGNGTPSVTWIGVDDTSKALSLLAARFYGDPASRLRLLGVTGTNGKTTTAHLLRSILDASPWGQTGIIGTVGHGSGSELEAGVHTTPEPLTLHRLFKDMADKGCVGVVMEVSSHAVRQQRTWGVDFEIGMLTNVTRDHLDYHPSFDDYISAKREFCYTLISRERKKKNGTLIYSSDNDISNQIGKGFPGPTVSTSAERSADVYATRVEATINGTSFDLHIGADEVIPVNLQLLGSFNVWNALVAAAAARVLGIDVEFIKRGLEAVNRVPGRFEAIRHGEDRPLVIVDYSHTPDSLEGTLNFCRALRPNRLITVFGCGGDRDRGKRPIMGGIAQRLSDVCVVTSDNPRTEDPASIIREILTGMDQDDRNLIVQIDRRQAIAAAVRSAATDDLVAVCGKGHEDYQIIGNESHHFDDREEAAKALKGWKPK
ncbi:MAG: UDP-N-acetylmuramoyl-L-alanyl-D-glutamate--2,6-diaminopimelate ligase [Candidatus Latescibacterota bacterium]|nr:MAG: UDP-N-acetylmuramoyl-L-alanyl-D-glutamate--2,6-diaminopimelate ligase [Candidatus Latescibacterota bacterium]